MTRSSLVLLMLLLLSCPKANLLNQQAAGTSTSIYHFFPLNSQISIITDVKDFVVAVVKRNSLPCKRGQNRTAQCGSRE